METDVILKAVHVNGNRRSAKARTAERVSRIACTLPLPDYGQRAIEALLRSVAAGKVNVESAMNRLRLLACESMDYATLDHHRTIRKGFPEVVYCQGKTCTQVATIVERLAQRGTRVLGTRASAEQFAAAQRLVPELQYHPVARVLWLNRNARTKMEGVAVIAAGTSDLAVAEEAAITLELMGQKPNRIWDVGVAGLHRLLNRLDEIRQARVIVAIAGMEGALPGVLAGLVAAPVIAVPTSVGYGASFGGLAALLGMLNSCAPGLAVVNIDNGFGAAYMAAMINMLPARPSAGVKAPLKVSVKAARQDR